MRPWIVVCSQNVALPNHPYAGPGCAEAGVPPGATYTCPELAGEAAARLGAWALAKSLAHPNRLTAVVPTYEVREQMPMGAWWAAEEKRNRTACRAL